MKQTRLEKLNQVKIATENLLSNASKLSSAMLLVSTINNAKKTYCEVK